MSDGLYATSVTPIPDSVPLSDVEAALAASQEAGRTAWLAAVNAPGYDSSDPAQSEAAFRAYIQASGETLNQSIRNAEEAS